MTKNNGNEPGRLDIAEVATTRLVLPEQQPPPSNWPRSLGRSFGRLWYELSVRPIQGEGIIRLDASYDVQGGARLFRYISSEGRNTFPLELSAEEIEWLYMVSKAIQVSPHHGYLPQLTEDEEL